MEFEALQGVLNLDKPPGISSARAVDRVKRLLPRKTKIGHAGTLDPFATGVLVLLIGRATKACEQMMNTPKAYVAALKFGATTATDDPESPEVPYQPAGELTAPSRHAIDAVLPRFVGSIQQRPPAFSAMKIDGQRAYKLARAGEAVVLEARTVRVDRIDVLDYNWPALRLDIACGRGTYIRSLARDIGEALNAGAYLTELRRTRVGQYRAENAITLERLQAEGVERFLQPIEVGS